MSFTLDRALAISGNTRTHVARHMGISPSTVKRRMDGNSLSVAGGLDAFVDAVAEVVGVPPVVLWQDALVVWQGRNRTDEEWKALRREARKLAAQMEKDGASTDVAWDF